MKSTRHVKRLPPWKEVCSDDSTQEVHCGVMEQPDWREASSMTENSSWHSDSSGDTTEPWVARIYAWEDLGDRVGLPEDYCRPPIGEVKQSLHDLVIPNEFAGKSHRKEMLLEIHEVDLIEDVAYISCRYKGCAASIEWNRLDNFPKTLSVGNIPAAGKAQAETP
ncbi:hypothetical protein DD238_002786 [Peronospora effusa]|uniref:Uncharacterized protein n=1 Tax=Peronospora effusa TaxID=542832 RepID=A0A3M6VHJ3_9STRA|nr:hypothetical protein DD238_002786 [Peronospora effusa]